MTEITSKLEVDPPIKKGEQFKQSVSCQSAVSQKSVNSQSAVSSKLAVSQQSVRFNIRRIQ